MKQVSRQELEACLVENGRIDFNSTYFSVENGLLAQKNWNKAYASVAIIWMRHNNGFIWGSDHEDQEKQKKCKMYLSILESILDYN